MKKQELKFWICEPKMMDFLPIEEWLESGELSGLVINNYHDRSKAFANKPGKHVLNIGRGCYEDHKRLLNLPMYKNIDTAYIDAILEFPDRYNVDILDLETLCRNTNRTLTIGSILKAQNTCVPARINYTYGAYRWNFQFLRWRIPVPFSTPIHNWKIYHKKFGSHYPMVWINPWKNRRNFRRLIVWTKKHGKDIYLWIGHSHLKRKDKVVKLIKEIVRLVNV